LKAIEGDIGSAEGETNTPNEWGKTVGENYWGKSGRENLVILRSRG